MTARWPSDLLGSGRFACRQEFGGDLNSVELAAEGCKDDQKDDRQNRFEGMRFDFRPERPPGSGFRFLLSYR